MAEKLTNLQEAIKALVDIINDAVAKLTAFIDSFKNKVNPTEEKIDDDQIY